MGDSGGEVWFSVKTSLRLIDQELGMFGGVEYPEKKEGGQMVPGEKK